MSTFRNVFAIIDCSNTEVVETIPGIKSPRSGIRPSPTDFTKPKLIFLSPLQIPKIYFRMFMFPGHTPRLPSNGYRFHPYLLNMNPIHRIPPLRSILFHTVITKATK